MFALRDLVDQQALPADGQRSPWLVWLWCYPLTLPWDAFVSPHLRLMLKNLGAELGARGCWLLCGAALGFPSQKGMGRGPGGGEI